MKFMATHVSNCLQFLDRGNVYINNFKLYPFGIFESSILLSELESKISFHWKKFKNTQES